MRYEIYDMSNSGYFDTGLEDYIHRLGIYWPDLRSDGMEVRRRQLMDMRDWLQDQYGLNRGYRVVDAENKVIHLYFRDKRAMVLFKVVFG
ncbi:hypothetical protein D3C87_666460 [compost metagenome]